MSTIDQLIELLAPIRRTPEGIAAHLWRLILSEDEYLRVGGMCMLIETGRFHRSQSHKAIELSNYPAVRTRAFGFFLAKREYEVAEQLMDAEDGLAPPNPHIKMQALLDEDWQKLTEFESRTFLHDGLWDHLLTISGYAERAAGWREGSMWALRALLLNPMAPMAAGRVLSLLEGANRFEELRQVVQILGDANIHPDMRWVFEVRLCLHDNDLAKLSKIMASISLNKVAEHMKARVCNTLARACEAQGKYRKAHSWFEKQNSHGAKPAGHGDQLVAGIERLAAVDVGELGKDSKTQHYMMVGFPRSGTTLLENALAAHPEVETFEEIPSYSALFNAIVQITAAQVTATNQRRTAFEAARNRYYAEIERRIKTPSACVYIDKMPINSAYIEILEKIFPDKKYIFSIRHPYDVVLSCFQQRFLPNQAMENFRRFDDTCSLYDRIMTKWFSVFPGPTERVHYVKYDGLIQNFEDELRKLLDFLGLEWNDGVRDFATLSERRRALTPSYGKVRAGLTLGAQSSWQNYRFLFETAEAKPLRRWVERFGYQAA